MITREDIEQCEEGYDPGAPLVAVTLGDGNEFIIDKDNDMAIGRISEPSSRIYLGKASVQSFQNLLNNMGRLQCHMDNKS